MAMVPHPLLSRVVDCTILGHMWCPMVMHTQTFFCRHVSSFFKCPKSIPYCPPPLHLTHTSNRAPPRVTVCAILGPLRCLASMRTFHFRRVFRRLLIASPSNRVPFQSRPPRITLALQSASSRADFLLSTSSRVAIFKIKFPSIYCTIKKNKQGYMKYIGVNPDLPLHFVAYD